MMKSHTKRQIAGVMFVLPALAIAVLFFVYPMVLTVRHSFTNWDGFSANADFVGFKNFSTVLGERSIKQVFFNTFYLAVLYIPVLNVLALLLAICIYSVSKLKSFYKAILYLPQMISLTVVGFVWRLIYAYDGGLLNRAFSAIGMDFLVQDWLGQKSTVLPAMSVTILWSALGYFTLIYLAGLNAIPTQLYESAEVDGVGAFRKLFHITLPMLAQAITINITLSAIGIVALFDIPYVLTKGGPGYLSETLALRVYMYAFAKLRVDYGLATAVMLGIISISMTLAILKLLRRREVVYS